MGEQPGTYTRFLAETGRPGAIRFEALAEGPVRGFYIRATGYIEAVQIVYRNAFGQEDSTDRYGGQGGTLKTLMLEEDEWVTAVAISGLTSVECITVCTNQRRRITFGDERRAPLWFTVPDNASFCGFHGSYSAGITSIGIILRHESAPRPRLTKRRN